MAERNILAHYYQTRFRDQKTGAAYFSVIPCKALPEADNGILKCKGKIKLYAKGMPIEIQGEFDERNIFCVSSDRMPINTQENVISILEYIKKDIPEKVKILIADSCKNDLVDFCKHENNLSVLNRIIEESKCNIDPRMIFRRVNALVNKNGMEEKLLSYGISFDIIMRMIKKDITLEQIHHNPYYIFSKFDVTFRIADVFARKECGIAPYDIKRIKGFIVDALKSLLSNGDTCCTLEKIESYINTRYRDIQGNYFVGKALINTCIIDMKNVCTYRIVDNQAYVYLNHVWDEETSIIHNLLRLQSTKRLYKQEVSADDTQKELGIEYNEEQLQAFRLLKSSGIKILTGPPGSGKTAIVNGLIHNFLANNNGTVRLAATTGMASKVMQMATERESETVHKLLRIQPYQDTARGRDLNDPVDADLIIVDEISMIGLQVFSVLLQAVKNGSILILVGDEDQLLSVDYGNVLHDLISSGCVDICRLKKCIRNSGSIRRNAVCINSGNTDLIYDSDFKIHNLPEDRILNELLAEYSHGTSQIICPTNQGIISKDSINNQIQYYFNSKSAVAARYGKRIFRLNDRIIFKKTNYEKNYINSDSGVILDYTSMGDLLISLPEGELYISKEDYCNIDLAYAITIHKSQGTTFQKMHIVLPLSARNMMTRRLLYTAVTRAKHEVIIYNEGDSINQAICNESEQKRFTLLCRRIMQYKR